MPSLTVGQRVWVSSGIHHGRRGVVQWTHQAHLAIIVGVAVDGVPNVVMFDPMNLKPDESDGRETGDPHDAR